MEDYLRALNNAKTPEEHLALLANAPDHRGYVEQRIKWAREGRKLASARQDYGLEGHFLCLEANAFIDAHKYETAGQRLEQAKEVFQYVRDTELSELGTAKISLYQGRIALRRGKARQAASYFRTALIGFRNYGTERDLVRAEYNLGSALGRLGELDAGKEYITTAQARSYNNQLWENYIDTFSALGVLHYEAGDMDSAIRHFSEGISEARKRNDLWRVARCCGNLGTVYQRQGKFHAALDNYHQALILAQQLNDLAGAASAKNNIANLYHVQAEHKQAVLMYQQTLADKEGLGDERSIAITLLNMSSSLVVLGDLDRAEKLLARADNMILEKGLQDLTSQYHYNQGKLQTARGEFEAATAHLLNARRIALEGNRFHQVHRAELGLVKTFTEAFKGGQNLDWENLPLQKEPEEIFRDSSDFFREGQMAWELEGVLETALAYYLATGQERSASDVRNQLLDLNREIHSSDKVEALARMEAELELRRKETELSDLKTVVGQLRQFAHSASHDLRDPLNSILNFSKLLEDKLREGPDREYVRFIARAADQMSDILRDLLDYARAEKQESVEASAVDLNEVLQIVHDNLHDAIESNDAVILVEHLPVIRAHRTRLVQLFQNLISNAIKYRRPEQHPEISIHFIKDRQGLLGFEVRDNGSGIRSDDRERVFEPFARAHEDDQGTGIGLAVCRRIVEGYGGRIWVEEAPQGGASFRFTLSPESASQE